MFCARAEVADATRMAVIAHGRNSETRMLPINRRNCGPRVVGAQDAPVVRAGTCTPDGAPLTHSDAMTVSVSSDYERRDRAVGGLPAVPRKVRAGENLARGGSRHEANVVLAQREMAARGGDVQRAPPPRRGPALDVDRPNGPDAAGGDGGVVAQILVEHRAQRRLVER